MNECLNAPEGSIKFIAEDATTALEKCKLERDAQSGAIVEDYSEKIIIPCLPDLV
ncbi:hypothetical protein [Neobacillus sp. NPDC093127]|uniref:hypothetical protein n=1 Tax=Neobacillus sp. NPDC093127 TaxID=3364296 RepID=UPI0037FFEEA1